MTQSDKSISELKASLKRRVDVRMAAVRRDLERHERPRRSFTDEEVRAEANNATVGSVPVLELLAVLEENEALKARLEEVQAERDAAREALTALVKALEPFKREALTWDIARCADDHPICLDDHEPDVAERLQSDPSLTAGDFRALLVALAPFADRTTSYDDGDPDGAPPAGFADRVGEGE